ncbi:SH3 domain-binding glutamic acid-rich-like protein 3 [Lethenteron reissneri]|uniref:SH3 domain-binding glutamic acid-rich-like protein 3 n=1 Tax=Lethenteron reissneri TaxID=7753 RepID=UPI002AB64456|nr:SH3 domain-binding glutamic acid-rich-like protein 3 [Lethenteron reissneri]
MVVKVYYTSVAASREVKSNQSEVQRVLEAKGLKFEMVDIAANDEHRQNMRKLSGNPTAMPPQLFNENAYCGDYEKFAEAVELDSIDTFLKLK